MKSCYNIIIINFKISQNIVHFENLTKTILDVFSLFSREICIGIKLSQMLTSTDVGLI